ncbi:PspC domain-containing protein [Micromonospora craniellae]|uniref:PspC domain-containing protein n=1 Tax=Micromonospora craniellae TaxID=2294034 RepID=A0A372G5B4_9ACTN|nr:PspC domain-containing protein [Micromonospora craniellae]RFS48231.1 PspC domain-containing protein [Micromonospora craniellae]
MTSTSQAPYKQLRRPTTDRMIAGVASGVGRYFAVDPALVRVGFAVVTLLTGGVAALAYPVMWFLMPEEPAGAPAWPHPAGTAPYAAPPPGPTGGPPHPAWPFPGPGGTPTGPVAAPHEAPPAPHTPQAPDGPHAASALPEPPVAQPEPLVAEPGPEAGPQPASGTAPQPPDRPAA